MGNCIIPYVEASGSNASPKFMFYQYVWSYNNNAPSGIFTATVSNFSIDKLIILNAAITYITSSSVETLTVPCAPKTNGNPDEVSNYWTGHGLYNGTVYNASFSPQIVSKTQFRFIIGYTNRAFPIIQAATLCMLLSYS